MLYTERTNVDGLLTVGFFSTMVRSFSDKDMWVVYTNFATKNVVYKDVEKVVNEEAVILFYKIR